MSNAFVSVETRTYAQRPDPTRTRRATAAAARHPERGGRRPAVARAGAPGPADGAEGPGARGRHERGQGPPLPGELRQARADRAGWAVRPLRPGPAGHAAGADQPAAVRPGATGHAADRRAGAHAGPHRRRGGVGQPRADDGAHRGGAVRRAREHAPWHGDEPARHRVGPAVLRLPAARAGAADAESRRRWLRRRTAGAAGAGAQAGPGAGGGRARCRASARWPRRCSTSATASS